MTNQQNPKFQELVAKLRHIEPEFLQPHVQRGGGVMAEENSLGDSVEFTFVGTLRQLISDARSRALRAARGGSIQVLTYWQVGRHLWNSNRAAQRVRLMGKRLLPLVPQQLTAKSLARASTNATLRNMRAVLSVVSRFVNALRSRIGAGAYRLLTRVDSAEARRVVHARSRHPELERPARWSGSRHALRALAGQPGQGRRLQLKQGKPALAGLEPRHVTSCAIRYARVSWACPDAATLAGSGAGTGADEPLQGFLLELGKGLAFVARRQRISTESKDFYIDLVFYNYLLKCFRDY